MPRGIERKEKVLNAQKDICTSLTIIYLLCATRDFWWRQEFSEGGLKLSTRELKYDFWGAINAKKSLKN